MEIVELVKYGSTGIIIALVITIIYILKLDYTERKESSMRREVRENSMRESLDKNSGAIGSLEKTLAGFSEIIRFCNKK
jgi:hypothetical protein